MFDPFQCLVGTFQDESEQTECKPCSVGHYCPYQSMSSPFACSSAHYQDKEGASLGYLNLLQNKKFTCKIFQMLQISLIRYCTPCPAGMFQDTYGSSACKTCPAAKYCPAQVSAPLSCPSGTYRNFGSGKRLDDCFPCTTGSYCHSSSIAVINCPEGYYQPQPGMSTFSDCIVCPKGSYCPTATPVTYKCDNGYYLNYDFDPGRARRNEDCTSN